MSQSNDVRERVDELLEIVPDAWCRDCEHPVCIDSKKAIKSEIWSILEQSNREAYEQGYKEGWNAYNEADYNPQLQHPEGRE